MGQGCGASIRGGAWGPAVARVGGPEPVRPGPAAVRPALPTLPGPHPADREPGGGRPGPGPTSAPPDAHPGGRAGAPDPPRSAAGPGRSVGKSCSCVTLFSGHFPALRGRKSSSGLEIATDSLITSVLEDLQLLSSRLSACPRMTRPPTCRLGIYLPSLGALGVAAVPGGSRPPGLAGRRKHFRRAPGTVLSEP